MELLGLQLRVALQTTHEAEVPRAYAQQMRHDWIGRLLYSILPHCNVFAAFTLYTFRANPRILTDSDQLYVHIVCIVRRRA